MSIFDKAKELLGRAEELYGRSHGDAAATVAGEAHVLEAEAEQDAAQEKHRPDDEGLAGAR